MNPAMDRYSPHSGRWLEMNLEVVAGAAGTEQERAEACLLGVVRLREEIVVGVAKWAVVSPWTARARGMGMSDAVGSCSLLLRLIQILRVVVVAARPKSCREPCPAEWSEWWSYLTSAPTWVPLRRRCRLEVVQRGVRRSLDVVPGTSLGLRPWARCRAG